MRISHVVENLNRGGLERVVIDLSDSHIWDASSVAAIDAVVTKYEQRGKRVVLEGMNSATTQLHGRLSGSVG